MSDNFLENDLEQNRVGFEQQLKNILDREITPANIATIESEIMSEVVSFVETVVQKYRELNEDEIEEDITRETEDRAFIYFQLGDVNEILDKVIELLNKISEIDYKSILRKEYGFVLLSAGGQSAISRSEHVSEAKKSEDKLEALLFLLSAMEVETSGITLHIGEKPDANSFRQQPYYGVELEGFSRLVLVCNEAETATYIFDTGVLKSLGISIEQILSSTKEELLGLIEDTKVGKRIRTSSRWLGNLQDAIVNPFEEKAEDDEVSKLTIKSMLGLFKSSFTGNYFDEQTGVELLPLFAIARATGKSRNYIQRIIDDNNIVGKDISALNARGGQKTLYPVEKIYQLISKEEYLLPQVDTKGYFRGFFSFRKKHYGPLGNITERIPNHPSREVLQGIVDKYGLDYVTGRDESGQKSKLYCLEVIQAKLTEKEARPKVDDDGYLRIVEEDETLVYGPMNRINEDYGIQKVKLKRLIDEGKVRSWNASSTTDTEIVVYCVNDALKFVVPKVDEDGYYRDENGMWGSLGKAAEYLVKDRDTLRKKVTADNVRTKIIRDLTNHEITMYCIDDISALYQ